MKLGNFINWMLVLTLLMFGFAPGVQAANVIYPKYKEAVMSGGANVDLLTCDLRAALVDTDDYTYSAAHQFFSEVPIAARVAISPSLTGKTVSGGDFDTADFTWSAVTGDVAEGIILYCNTGADGTSPLVHMQDSGVAGLPVTPNGGDVNFTVNGLGWFTL